MFQRAFIIGLGAALIAASCSSLFNSENGLQVSSTISFYKSVDDCKAETNPDCTFLSAEYPIIEGENSVQINKKITELTLSACSFGEEQVSSLDEAGELFIQEYVAFLNDFPEASSLGWEIQSSISWEKATDSLYNLKQVYTSYTGGAHENYSEQYFVFSTHGNVISLNNLFHDSYEAPLTALINDSYRKMNGLTDSQSLTKHGNLFVDQIEPSDNFYFTNQTMHFVYNAYDIAPYSEGLIDISIPLQSLAALFKPSISNQIMKNIAS